LKLVAHYVFSGGVLFAVGYPLLTLLLGEVGGGGVGGLAAGVAAWLAVASNALIDRVGHVVRWSYTRGAPYPARAWRTHSVYTAPIWGVIPAAVVAAGAGDPSYLGAAAGAPVPGVWGFAGWAVGLGVIASYTHLLLDSFTEAGVFAGRGRRVALAHLPSNSWWANLVATLGGLGLIFLTVSLAHF